MKKIILLLIVFMSFSLMAQTDTKVSTPILEDQNEVFMNKISSDSGMRVKMLSMMIDSTSGNKEEMTILAKCMLDDPEMYELLTILQQEKKVNISSEIHGVIHDSGKDKNELKMKQITK
ncbi:MAG: hypothetical protein WAR79_01805 [Melioribacteraceae bacterium]